MTDEERGRKRYCMKCEKVKPVKEFAETSKGGIERNCKLHSTGKDDTSMTEVGKTRFCKKCKDQRPIEEFSRHGTKRLKRICMRHEVGGSALPAVRGSVAPVMSTSAPHPAMQNNGRYTELFKKQGGRCAICGNPETARDEIGHVPPLSLYGAAHYGNRVHGLVCKLCNMGLLSFRDSPALLAVAIAFLTRKVPSMEGDVRIADRD
ncbi:MAG: hypothetical protein UW83_C0002G0011 [Parcubacteria group bacterium GW2011_GWD1_44_9]|nr:MAG: hypothetical protein UV94_C0007G0050 [Parcubacteria group bacterium GW2011_GWC1_43_30]KKT86150.1 MAG: hypothetical protein UW83_C0002G0011 [Parcubacteria group bacterium GW2011_GWD1_44_9]